MAYEYESKISSLIIDNPSEIDGYAYDEIKEVYNKAKAFDEIMKIDNQATDEDRITGEYESDIETVLSEYKERADDER